jgi:AcrR family transcriptional regulator
MLEAAAELFHDNGYAVTTFRDIEKLSGLNVNSMFREAKDKQTLACMTMAHEAERLHFRELLNQAKTTLYPNDPANIRNLIELILRAGFESRLAHLCYRAVQPGSHPEIRRYAEEHYILPITFLLEAFVKESVRLGKLQPQPVTFLIDALVGHVFMILLADKRHTPPPDTPTLAREIVDRWLNGVGKKKDPTG